MDIVQDLIRYSYDQKPIEFQHAFDDAMADKIATAIDNKKVELAKTMFTDEQPEIDQQEVADSEEGNDGLEPQEQEETENGEAT
jgi:CO dehydrogenase/acetyl-CoA synthase beta subunit